PPPVGLGEGGEEGHPDKEGQPPAGHHLLHAVHRGLPPVAASLLTSARRTECSSANPGGQKHGAAGRARVPRRRGGLRHRSCPHQGSEIHVPLRRTPMADTKDKVKDKIDDAADKAKDLTDKATDKAKDAAKSPG